MDGVTILNTFVETGAVMQPWMTIGLILSIGGIMVSVFGLILTGTYKNNKLLNILVTVCLICVVIGISMAIFAPREAEDRYQVIIDDSVSFNEFYEHYEVLEINGKIYTVRVLTNEE